MNASGSTGMDIGERMLMNDGNEESDPSFFKGWKDQLVAKVQGAI